MATAAPRELWTSFGPHGRGFWWRKARNSMKPVVGPWRLERQTSTVSRLSNQSLTDTLLAFSKSYEKSIWTAFGPHGPYLASLDLTWTSIGTRVWTSHLAFGTTVASRARARLQAPFACPLLPVHGGEGDNILVSIYGWLPWPPRMCRPGEWVIGVGQLSATPGKQRSAYNTTFWTARRILCI